MVEELKLYRMDEPKPAEFYGYNCVIICATSAEEAKLKADIIFQTGSEYEYNIKEYIIDEDTVIDGSYLATVQ